MSRITPNACRCTTSVDPGRSGPRHPPGEGGPAGDQQRTADRSDGAEAAKAGDREQVEAAREDDRAGEDNNLIPLAEIERRHVLRVLERVGGNKIRAAKVLGIHRATVHRILNGNNYLDVRSPK